MRLNCGFLCIGYSLIFMYLIYREGEELLWLLLFIKVGVVELNFGFIYFILEDFGQGERGEEDDECIYVVQFDDFDMLLK